MSTEETTSAGTVIAEGKTKIILADPDDGNSCIVRTKDDITAGDGEKHDVLHGKAELATRTTCNVFRLLQECGVPVAWTEQIDSEHFRAPRCDMIPLEVVCRREAHGSYRKRMPQLGAGHVFPRLVFELFLKTEGRCWGEHELESDDPFLMMSEAEAHLFHPKKPFYGSEPFLTLSVDELCEENSTLRDFLRGGASVHEQIEKLDMYARWVFLVLEKAWQLQGKRLVDFKIEFGIDSDGNLLVADVIDNDSWRVIDPTTHEHHDKQRYRDGSMLDDVLANYRLAADLTDRFGLPNNQSVIIWSASPRDDLESFENAFQGLSVSNTVVRHCVCSLHKESARAYEELFCFLREFSDSVIITNVGRSNGAGPTLAAMTSVPVISTVPGFKEFPQDVWSSLRTPSLVPLMTVLEPGNAVLAALQILAIRNPAIYAELRINQEERLANQISL